jgi:hypothetical protein
MIFLKVCDFELPNAKEYAVGMVFMPKAQSSYFAKLRLKMLFMIKV